MKKERALYPRVKMHESLSAEPRQKHSGEGGAAVGEQHEALRKCGGGREGWLKKGRHQTCAGKDCTHLYRCHAIKSTTAATLQPCESSQQCEHIGVTRLQVR